MFIISDVHANSISYIYHCPSKIFSYCVSSLYSAISLYNDSMSYSYDYTYASLFIESKNKSRQTFFFHCRAIATEVILRLRLIICNNHNVNGRYPQGYEYHSVCVCVRAMGVLIINDTL